jgi:hypothetical protein
MKKTIIALLITFNAFALDNHVEQQIRMETVTMSDREVQGRTNGFRLTDTIDLKTQGLTAELGMESLQNKTNTVLVFNPTGAANLVVRSNVPSYATVGLFKSDILKLQKLEFGTRIAAKGAYGSAVGKNVGMFVVEPRLQYQQGRYTLKIGYEFNHSLITTPVAKYTTGSAGVDIRVTRRWGITTRYESSHGWIHRNGWVSGLILVL